MASVLQPRVHGEHPAIVPPSVGGVRLHRHPQAATYHRAMPPAAPRRFTMFTVLLTALATGALVLLALNFTAGEKKVQQQLPRLYNTAHPQFERALGSLLGPGIVGGNAVTELLNGDQRLQQSIRLRNPYVDPISLLQVELLARWRDAGRPDDDLLNALVATVNGIAAGVQNTG